MIAFTGIRSYEIDDFWTGIEPLIQKPLNYSRAADNFHTKDILEGIKAKRMQCWAVMDKGPIAVLITEFTYYPKRTCFDVFLVGGSRMDEWIDKVWLVLKAYAKENDCQAIRGFGRKGWVRKLKENIDYSIIWDIEL